MIEELCVINRELEMSSKKLFSPDLQDPKCIDDITPSFVTSFLKKNTNRQDLLVSNITCSVIKPGLISGMTGGIYRLTLEYKGRVDLEWPRTIILKANPSDKTVHENMLSGARKRGLGFLTPLMPNLGFNYREIMSYKYLYNRASVNMPIALVILRRYR